MNQRLKTIKIITAALVIFIVLLIAAMLINFVSLARVNARKRELEKKLATLTELSADYADEIEYKNRKEVIERSAREDLSMQLQGEQGYSGKDE